MKQIAFGLTDIGRKRLSNEDTFLVDDDLGLYVVADGMGGHNAGEVASGEAVETLHGMVKREEKALREIDALPFAAAREPMPSPMRKTLRLLESAVQAATYMVFGIGRARPRAQRHGHDHVRAAVRGGYAITAQVGDSRIYLHARRRRAEQVTEDHTLVNLQVKQGLITRRRGAALAAART